MEWLLERRTAAPIASAGGGAENHKCSQLLGCEEKKEKQDKKKG